MIRLKTASPVYLTLRRFIMTTTTINRTAKSKALYPGNGKTATPTRIRIVAILLALVTVLSMFGIVNANAATPEKVINIDNAFCSATIVKAGDKFSLTLTTGSWVKSTSWSATNTSIAKIDKQNNKLSAVINPVAHGEANIKVTINYYLKKSETIVYKVIVYEEKLIKITPCEQKKNFNCAGAAAYSVLRGLGTKYNGDDLTLYNSLPSITIGNIAKKLKTLTGKDFYAKDFYNLTAFENAVIASLKKGCPVVIRITLKNTSSPFKYSTHGHFTCISGYRIGPDGSIEFTITDSWKISTNGGTFKVASSSLYGYARTGYNSETGKYTTCACWIAAAK